MKVLFCLLIATLAIGALATGRPSFEIEHLDWETKTAGGIPYATLASSGDLLIYYDTKDDSYIAVRRRNSEGGYDQVANITRYITPQVRSAHGKWIWTTYALWKIDANNQLTDESFIGPTTGGSMLSDDTFVGYYDGQILTFEYQAEYNNWTILAGTELEVDAPAFSDYDVQSYRAYDNHLVFADASSSILIYQRQADKSWKLNDTITVPNLGSNIGVHFNGVDTVVLIGAKSLSDGSQGIVYIYTKNNNGTWNEQMFNASSLGYIGQTNLGASCAFIDQNTLLVSAGTVNYYNRAPFQIGKVLMMTRTNGGDWTPHIDIIGDDSDVFGMSIAVNDYDFVVHDLAVGGPNPSGRLRVYTAPLCFAQPINVTCNNQQLDDCSSLDNAQLYTVNQSPRCGALTPLLNGASLVDQTLQASFTFTRFETETLSCNATVTCPAPVVPVAPVAVNVPVKAPTAKVSGGSMIQSFGLAVLSLFLAPVLLV